MPVSKKSPKKASKKQSKSKKIAKKTVAKKVNKNDKEMQEIKKAVKDLPNILAQEFKNISVEKTLDIKPVLVAREEKSIPFDVAKTPEISEVYIAPKNSRLWLWSAVSLFTVIILALWVLSVSNLFYNSKNSPDNPLESLKGSKEELKGIFKNFEDSKPTTTIKDIIGESMFTTSTVSSTLSTTTVDVKKIEEAISGLFVSSSDNNLIVTNTKE
ncbi:MAG: hypothetical protein WC070_03295 [Candidatus Magasanikbacteria bacterium]